MRYSKLIKQLRETLLVTQEELAKILNVSPVTVNRWENGKYEPTMKLKRKLNKMFVKYNIKEEKVINNDN